MIIRDAVHKDVYFSDSEKEILDTKEMQRLRGIKQLGTCNLVYPTALHTRFDHSVGVNAVFKMIHRELLNFDNARREIKRSNSLLLETAALLHDVTHIPYGHTFEDEMLIFDRHDKRDRYEEILKSGEIGSVLDKYKLTDEVIELLSSKNPMDELDEPWMAQLLTDTICADILDYLRRDFYFTGMMKNYDDRIFKYFNIMEFEGKQITVLNLTKRNMLRSDALSEIIHILQLRYFSAERIYFHHTKVSSGAMLAKALNIARDYGLQKQDLYDCTDDQLMEKLGNWPEHRPDKRIKKIITRIQNRKILKRAYVISPRTVSQAKQVELMSEYHLINNNREKKEDEIANELKLETEDIVIYCMGLESLKEADVHVSLPNNEIKKLSDVPHLEELTSVMNSYQKIWKFYVFCPPENVTQVHDLAETIFGYQSEFKPKRYHKGLEQWIE